MMDAVMQATTIALGGLVFLAMVCRNRYMDLWAHQLRVQLWHVAVGLIGLCAAWSATVHADPLAFGTAAALAAYALLTLDEWEFGPPAWAARK